LTQAQQRQSRIKIELDQAKEKLEGLDVESFGNANLFTSAAQDALNALETARKTEQQLTADKSAAEDADNKAREYLSNCRQAAQKLTSEKSALENVLRRSEQADWAPALDSIQAKTGYEQALAAVLGEDLDAAIGGSAGLGQRLVSPEGDVVRWDGFTIASGVETSAAIKLKQQNRISELSREIETAQAEVETASQAFEAARETRQAADTSAREARKALPDLERADRAAQAAMAQYETDIARASAQKTSLEDRVKRLTIEAEDVAAQVQKADRTTKLGAPVRKCDKTFGNARKP